MLAKSVYVLPVSGISFKNIYIGISEFLNQQIFVSVSALKVLYRSGSNTYRTTGFAVYKTPI